MALVQSLTAWLRTRNADIRLKIAGPHGGIELDAKRVHDPEALIEHFKSITGG